MRQKRTLTFLRDHPEVFDRRTQDGKGGRVRWGGRKPHGYDGREALPWHEVRGRYWYPWRED